MFFFIDHYLTDTDVTINVGNYACYLYVEALCQLPSLVRRWWTNCPGRKKNFIDMLTKCYVAPSVAEREINNISSNIYHHPNINVSFSEIQSSNHRMNVNKSYVIYIISVAFEG